LNPASRPSAPVGNLEKIFSPSSIAVVGTSRRREAVGYALFRNLLAGGYTGVVYPVNPKTQSILGVRCYRSILEIPDPVDLAILIVPATAAVAAFRECVRKKVRGVIVISAGFKEVGADGAALEAELARLARRHGIPMIGPNCLGVINTDPAVRMNASFARSMPKPGRIAFVSQSGALCTAVLDYAKGTGIGFSKFISMGNKASVGELELLRYLGEDVGTDCVLMYLEDLNRPRELITAAREIAGDAARPKPILAIKSGRTAAGARAASSHTGSLAGSDEVITSVFAQGGILRVDSVQELFDFAAGFSPRKFPKGNRIAIVTNAGGPGILATDACVRYDLQVPKLGEKTRQALRRILPPTANFHNPVDVIGDARHDRYEGALRAVLRDSRIDGVIVILTPQAMTDIEEIAEVVGRAGRRAKKPVLACFMGIADVTAGERVLERFGVPCYRFPESAVRTMAAMSRYARWVGRPRTPVRTFRVDRKAVRRLIGAARRRGETVLSSNASQELLQAYGFPILPAELAATPARAAAAAEKIGFPVAVKISSPDILHKVDFGGVRLGLKGAAAVRQAAEEVVRAARRRLPRARIRGVMVQEMALPGREVILGFKRSEPFGPILMFGLGGTYVEIMKDVTFRLAPIRTLGARNMIGGIQAARILQGARGERPADLPKLEECLERLSQLAVEVPQIAELDINPMIAYDRGKGCRVVDARILLQPPPPRKGSGRKRRG